MYEEMTGIKIEHMQILVAVAGSQQKFPHIQYFPAAVKDWIEPLKDTIRKYNDENGQSSYFRSDWRNGQRSFDYLCIHCFVY